MFNRSCPQEKHKTVRGLKRRSRYKCQIQDEGVVQRMYGYRCTQVPRPTIRASEHESNDKKLQEILTGEVGRTENSRTDCNRYLPVHRGGKRCHEETSVDDFFQQRSDNAVDKNAGGRRT